MKAKPFKIVDGIVVECQASEAEFIHLKIPCPIKYRQIPVILSGKREGTPSWTWNGDVDKPTLRPSIRTTCDHRSGGIICHSWITNGQVDFLTDSTHANSGKTLDLMDF